MNKLKKIGLKIFCMRIIFLVGDWRIIKCRDFRKNITEILWYSHNNFKSPDVYKLLTY